MNYDAWAKFGAPEQVLKWVKEGVKILFGESMPPKMELSNRVNGNEAKEFVSQEIERLLRQKAIRTCDKSEIQCILPISCVPKKIRQVTFGAGLQESQ